MTRRTEGALRRRLIFALFALLFAGAAGGSLATGAWVWSLLLLALTACFSIAASIEVKQ